LALRVEIVVEGDVQKVGYRDYVQTVARSLGVKGVIKNLRDGNVKIVCEGEKEILDKFVRQIRVRRDFIKAKKVQVTKTSPATGKFKFFSIEYGPIQEEIGDRMAAAIKYAGATWKGVRAMHEDVKGVRSDVRAMHEDVKGLRGDMKDTHEDVKGLRGDVKGMHTDMNESFKEMASRYDAISATLNETVNTMKDELMKTREQLTRAVDNLSNLIQELIKERRETQHQA